jgi:CheY-like chemotaxis protein
MGEGRVRVLVVDDNAVIRTVVVNMLLHLGAACDAVTSGREALEAVRTARYDLILMDLRMPDIDGASAARSIREARSTDEKRPRIIAVTSSHVSDADCARAGMDGLLHKPVKLDDLRGALNGL